MITKLGLRILSDSLKSFFPYILHASNPDNNICPTEQFFWVPALEKGLEIKETQLINGMEWIKSIVSALKYAGEEGRTTSCSMLYVCMKSVVLYLFYT